MHAIGWTEHIQGITWSLGVATCAGRPQLCVPNPCRGVALGDSWISPTDFLAAWGPYLNALSLLDGQPLSNTATFAANAQVQMTISTVNSSCV